MREIKFRFWDKEFEVMTDFPQDFVIRDMNSYTDYQIMQYTGLKDKNGKEIYEGDVIRSVFSTSNNVVSYGDAGFYQIRNCRTKGTSTLGGNNEGSVVIGNIYENPELLEVSENDNNSDN